MKRWLRANLVGLVAIVLLVPATVAITFANEVGAYNQARATEYVSMGPGDELDYGGTGWKLEDVRRISWASEEGVETELPNATDLVIVTIEVTPKEFDAEGLASFCTVALNEMDGDSIARSWMDATHDPIDFWPPDGIEAYCKTELDDPYLMQSAFVVPSDTSDELTMQIMVDAELPRYLRLRLY
jgi:hypothetical protein